VDVLGVIREDRVVAVIRADRVADPAGLARTLVDAGIRCVEFTFTTPAVLDAIADATAVNDAVIGAGTVLNQSQASAAIEAGARFVVSPVVNVDVAAACRDQGVPVFLGALSPTEIVAAHEAGAAAVKVFPASGPSYLRLLRGPLPDIPLIPSGDIDLSNARAYLDAGAVAVNASAIIAPTDLVATGNHEQIRQKAAAFVAAIR
jgi:2-dehydro-3-deoxyphosphogluconate aldolase/(4S)-4-hydroxy-2-oxoglutarate aldolase